MIGARRAIRHNKHRKGFYSTPAWREFRRKILNERGWKCEQCGSRGELHVHHVKPVANDGSVFDSNNLLVSCRSCHLEAHKAIDFQRLPKWEQRLRNLVNMPIGQSLGSEAS